MLKQIDEDVFVLQHPPTRSELTLHTGPPIKSPQETLPKNDGEKGNSTAFILEFVNDNLCIK